MKPLPDFLLNIATTGTEKTPPDPSRTKLAFARVGYSLPQAIADLIDNSVDAEARTVLIRFLYDRNGVHRVFIVDDGKGMTEGHAEPSNAVRFYVAAQAKGSWSIWHRAEGSIT